MKRTLARALTVLLISAPLACKPGGQDPAPAAKKPAKAKADEKKAAAKDEKKAAPEDDKKAAAAGDAAKVGNKAPLFELADLDGKKHKLEAYAGKIVVLEWFNPGCPFVKYAHGEGPLKDMAAKLDPEKAVWLAINSGAAGKQGAGLEANKKAAKEWSMKHPILLDESGKVGHLFAAAKTPHMFVIDPDGILVYAGGIDNAPMGEVDGDDAKINYVDKALKALAQGKKIETPEAKAYGCTVKYAKKDE